MKLRLEYWGKVKHIDPENLVFLDETGVLLGLTRTHARSQRGTRAYAVKPFYRGQPDFNPIELWWSQLKSLLRRFSPTTTKMVDTIIAVALDLMNPKHLKNWFTNCCYCTSTSGSAVLLIPASGLTTLTDNPPHKPVALTKICGIIRVYPILYRNCDTIIS